MSVRVDTSSLISGAVVCGDRGLGVIGSVIRADTATGENGPGILYDDWDSSEDDNKEFRALIITPPTDGDLFVYEDGSFTLTGAADNTYTLTYRLYVDGVDLGTATETIIIGAGDTALTLADSTQSQSIEGVTLSVSGDVALVVSDSVQGQSIDSPTLVPSNVNLVVADMLSSMTIDGILLNDDSAPIASGGFGFPVDNRRERYEADKKKRWDSYKPKSLIKPKKDELEEARRALFKAKLEADRAKKDAELASQELLSRTIINKARESAAIAVKRVEKINREIAELERQEAQRIEEEDILYIIRKLASM